jgi:transcription-repair coupling factor (superfamily II helicase)
MNDRLITSKSIVSVTTGTIPSYDIENELLIEDINYYLTKGYRIILPLGGEKAISHAKDILEENQIPVNIDLNSEKEIVPFCVTLTKGVLKDGFEYPTAGIAFLCIKGSVSEKRDEKKTKRKKKNALKSIYDINDGDYVVHDIHGIGVYKGMHQLTVEGVTKDYLKIKYKGTDLLYVPVQQLDLLSKYVGSVESIKVNKLGGDEWNSLKTKVRKSVEDMAKELLELYAKRESSKGFAFSSDSELQADFENTFPYDETEDQLKAIESVKEDMENIRPMDRLICGDVGYGKTEIAMRGAFKAVSDGKGGAEEFNKRVKTASTLYVDTVMKILELL